LRFRFFSGLYGNTLKRKCINIRLALRMFYGHADNTSLVIHFNKDILVNIEAILDVIITESQQ